MSPNLLRAVSPCKDFRSDLQLISCIYLRFLFAIRILYPFIGDQPFAAVHIMENLHAGIELFQVRTGDGLKPMYRNGITPVGSREAVGIEVRETIDLCRGEKGKEIRSNAEKLKVEFAKAWEEDGAARQEIRKFIQMYA